MPRNTERERRKRRPPYPVEVVVIIQILKHEEISQAELHHELELPKATVHAAVERLEDMDFIRSSLRGNIRFYYSINPLYRNVKEEMREQS